MFEQDYRTGGRIDGLCLLRVTKESGALAFPIILRWAETCARHNRCDYMELKCQDKSFRSQLINMGYAQTTEDEMIIRRKIIYGIKSFTQTPEEW